MGIAEHGKSHTKLATTRWWQSTTLAEQYGVADADENDLYQAMDWRPRHDTRFRNGCPAADDG